MRLACARREMEWPHKRPQPFVSSPFIRAYALIAPPYWYLWNPLCKRITYVNFAVQVLAHKTKRYRLPIIRIGSPWEILGWHVL